MTSKEIEYEQECAAGNNVKSPLWEIAYQLAKLNEKGLADPEPGKSDAPREPGKGRDKRMESISPNGWPLIALDGSGRYGIWFGPGYPRCAFETEAEARDYIRDWVKLVNEYQPGSRVSEPSSEIGPTPKMGHVDEVATLKARVQDLLLSNNKLVEQRRDAERLAEQRRRWLERPWKAERWDALNDSGPSRDS